MRWLLGVLLALLPVACSPQSYVQQPPLKYQGDSSAVVLFSSDVDAACRRIGATSAEGAKIVGCHSGGVIVLPNPFSSQVDPLGFRDIAAHELGHNNGWPGDHPTS